METTDEKLKEFVEEDTEEYFIVDEDVEITKEEKKFLSLGLKFRMTSGLGINV